MSVRPTIVVSQCLGFAAVRYNGAIIRDDFVQRLARAADIIEVCPEVAIGLGVPRAPIRMELAEANTDGNAERNTVVLRQPATGRDITAAMYAFASEFLAALPPVDGFILKARSPSCGIAGVSVFTSDRSTCAAVDDTATIVDTRAGMFASEILRMFPDIPVADEITLKDRDARHHFLSRVFALARVREANKSDAATNPYGVQPPQSLQFDDTTRDPLNETADRAAQLDFEPYPTEIL